MKDSDCCTIREISQQNEWQNKISYIITTIDSEVHEM